MHFNTLERLRQQMYHCFERSRDGLFNLSDALLSEPQARSLPELSLSVFFQRRWPSVYAALQDGQGSVRSIGDRPRLRHSLRRRKRSQLSPSTGYRDREQ